MADAVLTILQPAIEDLRAQVSYGPLPVVWGDRLQMQQMMQNLVSNALKYRKPDCPVIVRITAEQTGKFWKISVADNGPGIAPEYQDVIFQPLKRLHGQSVAGTGMGLAVCRKIAERHGGKIWVDSQPGEGATFRFTLPCGGPAAN